MAAISGWSGPMWRRGKSLARPPSSAAADNNCAGGVEFMAGSVWRASMPAGVGFLIEQGIELSGVIELDAIQPGVALGAAVDGFRRAGERVVDFHDFA